MKKNIVRGLVLVGSLALSAVASADEGSEAINALNAQAGAYITAAFSVAIVVAGGFWGIKMMKKAFSRAG